MLLQIASLAAAAMQLAAYWANQRGWMGRENRAYSALNFVGSLVLVWVAVVEQLWGFIVLESAWALISLPPLLRRPER